jgi:hypothetical protein
MLQASSLIVYRSACGRSLGPDSSHRPADGEIYVRCCFGSSRRRREARTGSRRTWLAISERKEKERDGEKGEVRD